MPTAAVIIIGDEILSGKFSDENGPFLIGRLRALGTDLGRLAVIGDSPDHIADEVARCRDGYDHVITTGGVGPTHDDRTLEGVGRAVGRPMQVHPDLAALLDQFGMERSEANLRMVTVPEGATLVAAPGSSFPVVRVDNVWVLPGIPSLMRTKFEDIAQHFAGDQVHVERLYCTQGESEIAAQLEAVEAAFPDVAIGSYPRWGERRYRVMITVDSRDAGQLGQAVQQLRSSITCVD
ncbi:MAG: molybdopterin-binding protein, partial [Myxococcota bacterium]